MSDYVTLAVMPGEPARITELGLGTSGRKLAVVGGIAVVAGLLGGTNSYAIPESSTLQTTVYGRWTNNGAWDIESLSQSLAPTSVYGRSLQESVVLLRELSGLTWNQLAKLFGVSRRAVHFWANGGRMNSIHSARLKEILLAVQSVEADSGARRREILLAPQADGRTLYESMLEGRGKGRGVNAPAFRPGQLTEALHDVPDCQT